MPKPKLGSREGIRHQLSLSNGELSDLIDCVTIAADRADSSANDVAGTPKARKLALDRAKRLYALAVRLLHIDQ